MTYLKILLLLFIAFDISLSDTCYKCANFDLKIGSFEAPVITAIDGRTKSESRVKRAAAAATTIAPVKTTKVKTTKAPRTTTTEPPPPIKWSPILGLCIPFAIILIIVIALHVFRFIRKS